MQNALGTQLGYPSNRSKAGGMFGYLLNDTFTTNRSAGAVNGTNAEPGPGRRTVLDTNSKITVASEKLTAATGGLANFDPSFVVPNGISRSAGTLLVAQVNYTAGRVMIGWLNSPTLNATLINGARRAFVDFNTTASGTAPGSTGTIISFTSATATNYTIAIPLRASGAHYFIKGGAFTNWTYINNDVGNVNTALYPFVSSLGTTAVYTVDYIRVPSARWLPTPLASDSFAAWGTTDGLGHAETTGLGSGGSGEGWTSDVGTWAASGTAAASALDGGIAIATVDTSTADVIASVKVTRSAGNAGLVVRYADSSNYVYALHNGTNAQLIKVVAGTPTTLVNAAASYSAGADLRVICDVTKFRLYYNNALVGTEQTIADAGLASGTKQGLYTSDAGNTFDDLRIFARGTGGEYSALDSF